MLNIKSLLVLLCIPLLGDDDYKVREQVQKYINASLPCGMNWVREYAVNSEDCEIRHRCNRALDNYCYLLPTNYPCLPWIDSLPKDYPDRKVVIDKYLEQVRGNAGPWYNGPEWPEYRTASAVFVRDLLLEGESKQTIIHILDSMVDFEEDWRKIGGYPSLLVKP